MGAFALENGAVGGEAAQALGNLIANVAGLNLREDKGIGVAATLEPGNFCCPTTGDTAASNCISPSMASSGAAALALSQAFFTLVHRVTLAGALGGIAQEGNLGVNA